MPNVPVSTAGRAYAVAAPRVTDAVGEALRGAFGPDCAMPEEMLAALRKLDAVDRAQPN